MSLKFARILFPTDFSEFSLHALEHARDLADASDADLHCIYVLDEAYTYWSGMGPESIPVGPPPEEMLDLACTRMEDFCRQHLQGLKSEPTTHVTVGRPFAEIIAFARREHIDLIVMATHGRGRIAHMLLGSTTEKVVRKADCAVLTVRGSGQEFVMP